MSDIQNGFSNNKNTISNVFKCYNFVTNKLNERKNRCDILRLYQKF